MDAFEDLAKEFKGIPTGNLCDAMGKKGSMHSGIKPVYPSAKVAGIAFTVACPPNDNLTIHKAMDAAPAGSVLVVHAGGRAENGLVGEIMSLACQLKGIAGIVLDGGCRDVAEIQELDFPVFARGVNPNGTTKETLGSIGATVDCGGVVVKPGDIIVGDRDGVVVVPAERAAETLDKAKAIIEREKQIHVWLRQGKTTMEIFGLDALLKNRGLG